MSLALGTATIIRGDARALPLPDDSVDLIVTSPPYFALRSYQDGGVHYAGQIGSEPTPAEWLAALLDVTRECVRVLKPSGSLWVNLGDKYAGSRMDGGSGWATATLDGDPHKKQLAKPAASQGVLRTATSIPTKSLMGMPWRYALACTDQLGLILRAELIWAKPNGLPESVTDRVRRSHETWFHFTLNPRYYSAVDTIRECTGESGSRAKYGRTPVGAGSGPLVAPRPATASSGSTAEPCSLTALPMSCGWDPSLTACNLTTCAATASAATQHTLNPSPCKRTCSEALSLSRGETQSRPIVEAGTNTTRQTPMSHLTEAACAACACGPATGLDTGVSAPLGRLPGSVWSIPSEPLTVPASLGVDHFAAFPTEFPKRIIRGWSPAGVCVECGEGRRPVTAVTPVASKPFAIQQHERSPLSGGTRNQGLGYSCAERDRAITGYACACTPTHVDEYVTGEGDDAVTRETLVYDWHLWTPAPTTPGVVLDVFGGTGTTAMVAKALGRHGITIDLSADYCRLAEWRCNDRNQLAKVLGVEKVEQQPEEQGDLLDLLGGEGA